MVRPLALAVSLVGVCSYLPCRPGDERWNRARDADCAERIAAVTQRGYPELADLPLQPAVIERLPRHPHAVGRACTAVGLEPVSWQREGGGIITYVDRDRPGATGSKLRLDQSDCEEPARSESTVVHPDRDGIPTFVTRIDGGLRMVQIHRPPHMLGCLRCEAELYGVFEAAVPTIAAVCGAFDRFEEL